MDPYPVLARGWTVKTSSAPGQGATIPVGGLQEITFGFENRDADITVNADNGVERHIPSRRGVTVRLKGLYLEALQTRDAGQLALETAGFSTGTNAYRNIIIQSPGGTTYAFEAGVKMESLGGPGDEATGWECTLTRNSVWTIT